MPGGFASSVSQYTHTDTDTHIHTFTLTCCLLELTPLPTFTNDPARRETKKKKKDTMKHLWLVCSCQRIKFIGKQWIEGPLCEILALSKTRQCDVSSQGLWVRMCVCRLGGHSKDYTGPEEWVTHEETDLCISKARNTGTVIRKTVILKWRAGIMFLFYV